MQGGLALQDTVLFRERQIHGGGGHRVGETQKGKNIETQRERHRHGERHRQGDERYSETWRGRDTERLWGRDTG